MLLRLLERALTSIVSLRRREAGTAFLMFACAFLTMTAYNIVKPATRSKFISDLGADNLPWVQLGAGILIGVIMQGYSRAIAMVPSRWAIPITQVGSAVLLLAFWALLSADYQWATVGFYVLGLILGILLISQFWMLANDLYDARQAKRLFGFIGGGASLGGATGAGITAVGREIRRHHQSPARERGGAPPHGRGGRVDHSPRAERSMRRTHNRWPKRA